MCDEVRFKVLEADVHRLERRLGESERCCGMLKGDASRLSERVVVLEHDVGSRCCGVDGLRVGVAKQEEVLSALRGEVDTLRSRLWWAITVALGALIMDIIGIVR